MRNLWFYLGMFIVVSGMEIAVRNICGLDKLPTSAAVVLGVGSGVVATLAYILAKLEDRDKKDDE
jgi:hypothetical protein